MVRESQGRYQARISIDDRLGELWEHLLAVPKRSRVTELIFLAQLGLVTRKAIVCGPGEHQVPRAHAHSSSPSLREEPTAPAALGQDAGLLSSWASAAMDFADSH